MKNFWGSVLSLSVLLLFSGCLEDEGTDKNNKEVESTITTNSGFDIQEGDILVLNGNESGGDIDIYKFFSSSEVYCESERQSCEVSGLEVGKHKIYLTVEGDDGVSDTSDVTITVYGAGEEIPEDDDEPLNDEVVEFGDPIDNEVVTAPSGDDELPPTFSFESGKFLNVEREFEKSGDTVEDIHSGLVWEDHSDLFYGTHSEAEEYCQYLTLDGITDWRLPTKKELFYLIDPSSNYTSAYGEFQYEVDGRFWAVEEGEDEQNWLVNFSLGFDVLRDYSESASVRCVSGEEDFYEPELYETGNSVTDEKNDLMWTQPIAVGESFTLYEADGYCRDLDLDGYRDWRVPTVGELYSITDHSQYSTPFSYDEFYTAPTNLYYWTETEYYYPEYYVVDLEAGDLYWEDGNVINNILCIREIEE